MRVDIQKGKKAVYIQRNQYKSHSNKHCSWMWMYEKCSLPPVQFLTLRHDTGQDGEQGTHENVQGQCLNGFNTGQ